MLDAVAAEVRRRGIGLVVIAARGTSDHAAVYAQYVLGARNGLTVALAAPSLVTLYGASPRYGNALVIGLSQSGRSPDVVGVMAAARAQGALTLSITNDPASPLAMAAEHRIDLAAGEERSVAATKTYTAELLAVAMLSAALDDGGARAELSGVPQALAEALDAEGDALRIAADQAGLDRAVVLGRGFGYATAREWSLKLKEVAQLWADPYSAADFAHGPVALLAPGSAVFANIALGPARDALLDPVRALIHDVGADVLVLSDDRDARAPSAAGRWSCRRCPSGWARSRRSCRPSSTRCTWRSPGGWTRRRPAGCARSPRRGSLPRPGAVPRSGLPAPGPGAVEHDHAECDHEHRPDLVPVQVGQVDAERLLEQVVHADEQQDRPEHDPTGIAPPATPAFHASLPCPAHVATDLAPGPRHGTPGMAARISNRVASGSSAARSNPDRSIGRLRARGWSRFDGRPPSSRGRRRIGASMHP